MIALPQVVLGLAAMCADRAWRTARRERTLAAIRTTPAGPPGGPRRPATGAILAGGLVAVLAATWGPWAGVVGSAALLAARWQRARSSVRRDRQLLSRQISDAVGALASAIRSGRSLPQALGDVAADADAPLGPSLDEVVRTLGAGGSLDDALGAWADAVGTDEAILLAGSLGLHREVGGELPTVLDRVGQMLRERTVIEAEVRSMTAQARLSGRILGALPVAFLGVLWLVSRDDLLIGLSQPLGQLSLVIGASLELGAFLWIRRLLDVR